MYTLDHNMDCITTVIRVYNLITVSCSRHNNIPILSKGGSYGFCKRETWSQCGFNVGSVS